MSLKFSPVKMDLDATDFLKEKPNGNPRRTRAQPRGLLISCACCVFRHGAPAAKAGVPRTGRRVQANSSILTCAVELGQCKGHGLSAHQRTVHAETFPLAASPGLRYHSWHLLKQP